MQEKELPAKGGGRRRQRGFIHVMLFVLLFLGVTTYGVVHLQEEMLVIQGERQSITQKALQEARKGLLDYARPYPGMPQRYRDTVPIDPRYNFYTHEDLRLLQDDRYLVARPGQLPCPDMADTAHTHTATGNYNEDLSFLFTSNTINRMHYAINQEFMDEDDNLLDGVSDPGMNMCSFAFLPRGSTPTTVHYDYDRQIVMPEAHPGYNGSFFGSYPYREHSDLINFSRGAGVRDIRDGDTNRLWYAASPNVLSAHRVINPYQIIRQGQNWLNLELVPKYVSTTPVVPPVVATVTVADVAAVVISPGKNLGVPGPAQLNVRYRPALNRRQALTHQGTAANVYTDRMFEGATALTTGHNMFRFGGVTGDLESDDDEVAFITKTELLAAFNGLETVNSNHLDNIADALLAYHQRNNYLPDPATFDPSNAHMITRRLGRPALAADNITDAAAKDMALAAMFQTSDLVRAQTSADPRVKVLIGSVDDEGFRYAYQGGRVSYGYAGGTGSSFHTKGNEQLVTASLSYQQAIDVYITPNWIQNSVKRKNSRTAGTGIAYMLPPFASSQFLERDPLRQAVLYARQGTEVVTVDPNTPMILARPVFMTPATPTLIAAGGVDRFYNITTGRSAVYNDEGHFNVLFPDGRPNLAGNMARMGYQVYLPAGSVLRASVTVEFLRHKTRSTVNLISQDNGRAYEMVAGQSVAFAFGVAGEYARGTLSAPKNAALVPGNQGLLPTPLLPQQLPNHEPHGRGGTRAMDAAALNQGAHWQRQLGAVKKIPRYQYGSHVIITDRRGLAFGYYPSKVKLHPLIRHSIALATVSAGFPLSSNVSGVAHPTVSRPVIEIHPVTRFAHNGLDMRDWTANSVEFEATTPDPATFNGWIELPVGTKFFYPFGTRVPVGPLFSQSADAVSFGPAGPLAGDVSYSDPNATVTVSLPPGTVIEDMVVGLPALRRGASSTVSPAAYINHEYQLVTAATAATVARVTLEHGGIMKFSQLLHYHNGETALQPLTPAQADFRIETMGAVLIDKEFPLTLDGITLASPFHQQSIGTLTYDPLAMKKALNHVNQADQNRGEYGFQRHLRPLDEDIPLADGYYIYPYRSTFATMSRRTYPYLSSMLRSGGVVAHELTIELNSRTVTVSVAANSYHARRYRYRNVTSFIDNRGSRADVLAYATGRNRIDQRSARPFAACSGSDYGADFFVDTPTTYTDSGGAPFSIVFIRSLESIECDIVPLTVVERAELTMARLSVAGNHAFRGRAALVDQFGVGIEQQSFTGNASNVAGLDTGVRQVQLNFEQGVQMQFNPGRIWGGGLQSQVYLQRYGWAGDTTPLVAPFMRRDGALGAEVTITSGTPAATLNAAASEYAILIADEFGEPSETLIGASGLKDEHHDSIRFAGETGQIQNIWTSVSSTLTQDAYAQTLQTRSVVQAVATVRVSPTSTSVTVHQQTIGISETSTRTPGDFRYHERRVRFSFNSDATATDSGDGEPERVTHLPRGTKLEYGVMLQPSDHNLNTCHNSNLTFSPGAFSDATRICDNHYMPSGRLFRGVGFSPIPRRAAVVFNKPQQSILPLAGGGTLTIGMAYTQRELLSHICVERYYNVAGGADFWNVGPMYNPEIIKVGAGSQIYPHITVGNHAHDSLINDPYNACHLGSAFSSNQTWMRAGSYNKTNMSLHFRTADGYGNTATVVQNSSSTDNLFDNQGQELELTLWNVHLRVPAGAPFSPTEYLSQAIPDGRTGRSDSGKIFMDADVQLVATGYFPNCLTIRTDGDLTTSPPGGFLQLTTTRDPWERDCAEQGSVLLSNVIIPPARILMDTMQQVTHEPVDKRENSDELLVGPITFDRHKGKLQFYIEVDGWEDVADLQAVFPTYGGGSVIHEGSTFYGFRDYGYLWTQDYRNPPPPAWLGDIQNNQLLLYDLMLDNEGIERAVPQLQLSWSGRESEWNSMEFRPDSLVFAQNNPMFYAVAPECRRQSSLEAQDCALGADEGLRVNVSPGQAARLPEDSLIPAGLVIHGHRGQRGVSVRVNVLSPSGSVASYPGLRFHEDGRVESLVYDQFSIDTLTTTGTYLASSPGDELVIYNSDNGVNFRLEATGASSFPMARSSHAHGYLGSLTIIYGGHTSGNVAAATLKLTLAASVTVQARPGTEVYRDAGGMPRIEFGAGSQAVLAGGTTLSDVGGWQSTGGDFYLTAFIEGDWIEPSHRLKPPQTKDNLGGRRPIETGVPPSSPPTQTTNFEVFTQPQVISINHTPGYAWPGFVFGDGQTRILARNYGAADATVFMRNYPESGQVYGQREFIRDPSSSILNAFIDLPDRSVEVPMPSHYALETTSVLRTTVRTYDMSVHATTLGGCPQCGVYTVTMNSNGGDPVRVGSLFYANLVDIFGSGFPFYQAVLTANGDLEAFSLVDSELSHRSVTVSNTYDYRGAHQAPILAMTPATIRTGSNIAGNFSITTYFEDTDRIFTLTITGPATLSTTLEGTVSVEHQIPAPHYVNVDSATSITDADGFYSYAVTVPPLTTSGGATIVGEAEIGNLDAGEIGFVLENATDYGQLITTGAGSFVVRGPVALHQTQERALTNAIIPTNLPQEAAYFYRDHSQAATIAVGAVTNTITAPAIITPTSTTNLNIIAGFPMSTISITRGVATSYVTLSAGTPVNVDITTDIVEVSFELFGNPVMQTGFLADHLFTITNTAVTSTLFTQQTEDRDTASYLIDERMFLEMTPQGSNIDAPPMVGIIVPVPELVTDRGITILAGSMLLPNYGQYGAVLHAQAFASTGVMTMFVPPGETEAHLIAAGGAGRPIMLEKPALMTATEISLSENLTVTYDIVGRDNFNNGVGPVVTRTQTRTWAPDGSADDLLIALKNPVVQQTIMDFRLGDAIFHRRGAQRAWNPTLAPYEADILSRIYPYPVPYLHRLKPKGDTTHGWALDIYQHPSLASAVTLSATAPYHMRSWQLTVSSGTTSTVVVDDSIHPEFYSGPSTKQRGTLAVGTLAADGYLFYPRLGSRFTLSTSSSLTLATEVIETTITTGTRTGVLPGIFIYDISVQRTTLHTGLAYTVGTSATIDMSLGVVSTSAIGGLHDNLSVALEPYHQTFWVRLSNEITMSLSSTASVTLPVDTLINPIFGTYTLPFDFNDAPDFVEFELASRAQMHLLNTLEITRPIGVLPQGITIEFNRASTFDNVKAVLAYSPYPLHSFSLCSSTRDGTTLTITQRTEHAHFSGGVVTQIPDYNIRNRVLRSAAGVLTTLTGAGIVDGVPYPSNVGDADICMLNEVPENTDFDREFEFIDGPLFDQSTGLEVANNRMRMVGGRLLP
ncbi:MAG: hypothetical protein ISN26_04000 [Betaproteobacteria bacterium AqS2]|uniref:Uncharacterized protein n=1 Tax=Candidatus Amphirhobacter heronislandensis TaxID=1732024 RepID=A0A930XXV3_9GAMM|nr:hypothetical protein [Betaproteobacteria bacterium AqS2]